MKRLVILAPNWLGDAVMALPAIADVRRARPDAHVTIAARPSVAPMFRLAPTVDAIVVLERKAAIGRVSSWRDMGAELADASFDTALLLPNSMDAAVLAQRAGIPDRWGFATSWRSRRRAVGLDRKSGRRGDRRRCREGDHAPRRGAESGRAHRSRGARRRPDPLPRARHERLGRHAPRRGGGRQRHGPLWSDR